MVCLGIKKLGENLGLEKTDSEAVGFVKNIYVKIADRIGMKTVEIIFPEFTEDDKEILEQVFNENKVKEFNLFKDGVTIIFRESFLPYPIKKIHSLINIIVEYFNGKYPLLGKKCQNCGQFKKGANYYTKDGSKYLCDNCLNEIERKLNEEKINYDLIPKNYCLGILGSVLFSVPGILLTLIIFIFTRKIAAVSVLLYLLLAEIGYRKFKGKMTIFGAVIISSSGIIMIFIGIIVSYILSIAFQMKTFDGLWEMLNMPEIQKELSLNIILALLISLICIILNLFQLKKRWSFPKIKKTKRI
jgi:hypothetical protein